MKSLESRLRPSDDYFTKVKTIVDKSIMVSKSDQYRKAQGLLRMYGRPNTRDHSLCDHSKERLYMPRIAEDMVGGRNREKSASRVEILFDWSDLLDEAGDFYTPMIRKGITLKEGEDYEILDSDGNTVQLKSAPEKVRRVIVCELAERLNVPTSVKVPETGAHVGEGTRNWVSFRPRMNTPFTDDEARNEYIEKNGGSIVNRPDMVVEEEHNEEAN